MARYSWSWKGLSPPAEVDEEATGPGAAELRVDDVADDEGSIDDEEEAVGACAAMVLLGSAPEANLCSESEATSSSFWPRRMR